MVSGTTKEAAYQHNGIALNRYYCPHCATTLWYKGISDRDMLNVQGGTLVTQVKPVAHLWISSAVPWMRQLLDICEETAMLFETQPDRPELLIETWQTRLPH